MIALSIWTPEYTTDVIWAFERLVMQGEQVKNALSPELKQQLAAVKNWLRQMAALQQQCGGDIPPEKVPHLPLDGHTALQLRQTLMELRTGETAALGRRSNRDTAERHFLDPIGQLTQHLRQLSISSWAIGIGLISLVMFDVLSATIWSEMSRWLMEWVNLGGLALIFVIWLIHHFLTIHPHQHGVLTHIAIHHHRYIHHDRYPWPR